MTDLKTRIANMHMNLPQLKRPSISGHKEQIVLVEGVSNSIINKLNKHRKNETPEDKKPKEDPFKWVRIKEKMMMDMEDKRAEEWNKQTLNDKLENEELEEDLLDGDDDALSDDAADDFQTQDDAVTHEKDEDADEESDEDDRGEKGSFFDDQADEVKSDDSDQSDDDDDELFISTKTRPKIIEDDDNESENEINDTVKAAEEVHQEAENIDEIEPSNGFGDNDNIDFPFPFPTLDTQDDFLASDSDKFCISQNLPLTPLNSVDGRKNSTSNANGHFDDDSQMLANICSGQFGADSSAPQADDDDENDAATGYESDDGNANADSESGDDDEQPKPINKVSRKKHRISDFIEDEAELSGSDDDVSSDENDEEDDDELEQEEIQEDLPSDDELRGQLGKMYNKDLLDEDKRQLMIMKEYFFDDGDLHDEDDDRKKKFKWNLNGEEGMDEFTNVLSDSDDDDDDSNVSDDDGEGENKVIRLKKETSITTTIERVSGDEESAEIFSAPIASTSASTSQSITMVKSKTQTLQMTSLKKKKANTKISSFFIKDERLKGILNKRPGNFENYSNNFNKKQKTQESLSIFDVLNF